MLEILEPFFPGDWRTYGESLRLPDSSRARPSIAQWFSEPANLHAALARHADSLRGRREIKAVASDWSIRYFAALLPPVVAAASLLKRHMPTGWHEMALDLKTDGTPDVFVIEHLGVAGEHAEAAARYDSLVWQHLLPVITSIGAEARVPTKILWGNANRALTNIFAQALILLSQDPSRSRSLVEDRNQLLSHATWFDGRRNPLALRPRQVTVSVPGGPQTLSLHATCCLIYRLPHSAYCAACPLAPQYRKTARHTRTGNGPAPV